MESLLSNREESSPETTEEKLYERSHLALVRQCEGVQEVKDDDGVGFWISKPWFKGKDLAPVLEVEG